MRIEKASKLLTRLMLGLFMLMLAYAAVSCAAVGRTYLFPLLAAALLFAAYTVWARRCPQRGRLFCRLGAGKTCGLITLLFFAVNLPPVFMLRITPAGDYSMFWWCATELAQGVEQGWGDYVALFPHILGYSAFLSVFLKLFGSQVLVAALLNVLLTALSGLIIFRLALRWNGVESAALAYLLWTLCPSKLLYNTMVLSEPLYTTLLLLFILIVSELNSRVGETKRPLLLGAAAGAVSAVILAAVNASRPVAAIPIIAFFIWALLLRGGGLRRKESWQLYISFAVLLLALYFPLCSLWSDYVAQRVGEQPADFPAYSLYVGFNPDTNGEYSTEDAQLLQSCANEKRSAVGAQQAMREALEERLHSGRINYVKLFKTKLSTFLGFDDGGAYYMKDSLSPTVYTVLVALSNVFYYGLLLLALTGAARLFRSGDSSCALLPPLYVLGLTMAHMLVEVAARYHYSAIPMLVLIASFARGGALMNKPRGPLVNKPRGPLGG